MSEPDLYDFAAARSPDQLTRMHDLAARGVCSFCPEHVGTEQADPGCSIVCDNGLR